MNRRLNKLVRVWFAFTAALLFFLAGGLTFWWLSPTPLPTTPTPTIAPDPLGGVVFEAETETPTETSETIEEPLPPVYVHPRNAQRLERVEFTPHIGDIFRIVYDRPSETLFMAVVEPTGMRSIWRLSRDLQIERVLQHNQKPGEVFLGQDSRGNLYAHFERPGALYRSADLGKTWEEVATNIDGAFWDIADDSQGTVWGALHSHNKAYLYRSTDDGLTWEVWRDFQQLFPQYAVTYDPGDDRYMLRHLHAVAYLNGRLFVGTGDVTRLTFMSDEGVSGDQWEVVWNEGFTASEPLRDRSGLILGPDRLRARGLAVYDFETGQTTEVWHPRAHDYSGYTYSLEEVGGSFFAAFHNETNETPDYAGRSGIIVSPDGYVWYPFLEFDPLNNWARTDIFMCSAGDWQGYMTLNGALYRFEPPIGRWYEIREPFE